MQHKTDVSWLKWIFFGQESTENWVLSEGGRLALIAFLVVALPDNYSATTTKALKGVDEELFHKVILLLPDCKEGFLVSLLLHMLLVDSGTLVTWIAERPRAVEAIVEWTVTNLTSLQSRTPQSYIVLANALILSQSCWFSTHPVPVYISNYCRRRIKSKWRH